MATNISGAGAEKYVINGLKENLEKVIVDAKALFEGKETITRLQYSKAITSILRGYEVRPKEHEDFRIGERILDILNTRTIRTHENVWVLLPGQEPTGHAQRDIEKYNMHIGEISKLLEVEVASQKGDEVSDRLLEKVISKYCWDTFFGGKPRDMWDNIQEYEYRERRVSGMTREFKSPFMRSLLTVGRVKDIPYTNTQIGTALREIIEQNKEQ